MKKIRLGTFLLAGGCMFAQDIRFPEALSRLGSKAVETVDVTLDSSLLQLASRFLSDKDADEAKVKKIVSGLKGVYVKSFEFDHPGEYNMADVENIRGQLRSPGWSRIVSVQKKRDGENSEVYLKTDGGRVSGLTVIAAEAKQLTLVNIVGTIDPDDVRELSGHFGIPKIDIGTGKPRGRHGAGRINVTVHSVASQLLIWTLLGTGAYASDREFHDIVRTISESFGAEPTHIPFFGLANLALDLVRPAGAKHVDLAVFENLGSRRCEETEFFDQIRSVVGSAWKPFVTVHSRRQNAGETTLIYVRPDGHDFKFLITTVEPREAAVMEIRLDPKGFEQWMDQPLHYGAKRAGL